METVNWKGIIVGLLVVAVIARSQQIQAKLKELQLGDMVTETIDMIWAMPELGRFTCFCLFGALCFYCLFVLVNNKTRKRK